MTLKPHSHCAMSRRSAINALAWSGAALAAGVELSQGVASVMPSQPSRSTKGTIMTQSTPSTPPEITVVLVHGAFADSSSWNGVVEMLQAAGVPVVAVPNPLRSVTIDSAYVTSRLSQIDGPVLLVGHSYGGVVITNAGTSANNVVGLVYVAGFATDEGESLSDLEANSKDSVLNSSLLPLQYPTGDGQATETEFEINPEFFHEAFAADLPEGQTRVMCATQRPASALAFTEPSGVPAWKSLPAWAIVATGDKAAGTDVLRFTADRAGATITELEGSHVIMFSQPRAVTDVIMSATTTLA